MKERAREGRKREGLSEILDETETEEEGGRKAG